MSSENINLTLISLTSVILITASKYNIDLLMGWRPEFTVNTPYGYYPIIAPAFFSVGVLSLMYYEKFKEDKPIELYMVGIYFLIPFLMMVQFFIGQSMGGGFGYMPDCCSWEKTPYGSYPIVLFGFISFSFSIYVYDLYLKEKEDEDSN